MDLPPAAGQVELTRAEAEWPGLTARAAGRMRADGGLELDARVDAQADRLAKVGGLPPHLSIFELGFADKGRIYYTAGKTRRFRVLAVGAKNSQKTDLEYLSRLPKGT